MSEQQDSIEVYRKRRRRRNIWQHSIRMILILLVSIVAICGLLMLGHHFLPTINSFFSREESVKGFPISLSGESVQADVVNGKLAVLSDNQLSFYAKSGKSVRTISYGVSNAALSTSSKYALLYARGESELIRTTVYGTEESLTVPDDVTFAIVNDKGQLLVTTEDSNYLSRVMIYGSDLQEKYSYYSDIQIAAAALKDDSTECVMAGMDVVNGQIQIKLFRLTSDQTVTELATLIDELPLSLAFQGSDISLITDRAAYTFQSNGTLLGSYEYEGELLCYDHQSDSSRTVLVIQNTVGSNSTLRVLNHKKEDLGGSEVTGAARSVLYHNGTSYVLSGAALYEYSGTTLKQSYDAPTDTTKTVVMNSKLFVIGGSTVYNLTSDDAVAAESEPTS